MLADEIADDGIALLHHDSPIVDGRNLAVWVHGAEFGAIDTTIFATPIEAFIRDAQFIDRSQQPLQVDR